MGILSRFSLEGKQALITGPEFVYGLEIALGLCEAGARVWLAGEKEEEIRAVADALVEAGHQPGGVMAYRQGGMAEAVQLAKTVRERLGGLDIFVENNGNGFAPGWNRSYEDVCECLQRKQAGLLYTVQQLGIVMSERKKGSVLLVSDIHALVGCDTQHYEDDPDLFDEAFSFEYGYIKSSYVNYARQAAGFLGKYKVRCNCIAYGPLERTIPNAVGERIVRHSHLKRLAGADDIKSTAVFLASDASSFITGTTLPVDGGYVAK